MNNNKKEKTGQKKLSELTRIIIPFIFGSGCLTLLPVLLAGGGEKSGDACLSGGDGFRRGANCNT